MREYGLGFSLEKQFMLIAFMIEWLICRTWPSQGPWIHFLKTLNLAGFSYPVSNSSDTHCGSGVYNCMSKPNSVCRPSKILHELLSRADPASAERQFPHSPLRARARWRQWQTAWEEMGKVVGRSKKNLDHLSRSNFPGPLLLCCLAVADVVPLREETELLEHFLLLL